MKEILKFICLNISKKIKDGRFGSRKLRTNSIEQYRKEVRSAIAKRASNDSRLEHLIDIMKQDHISKPESVDELKVALQKLTFNSKFKKCTTMGDILEAGLNFVIKNYRNSNMR
jgi:hypothetical protein